MTFKATYSPGKRSSKIASGAETSKGNRWYPIKLDVLGTIYLNRVADYLDTSIFLPVKLFISSFASVTNKSLYFPNCYLNISILTMKYSIT